MHIKCPILRKQNRVRADFQNAIHVISDISISSERVAATVRSYADLAAFEYKEEHEETPNVNDGRCIHDRSYSFDLAAMNAEIPVGTTLFDEMKARFYQLLLTNADFVSGVIVE